MTIRRLTQQGHKFICRTCGVHWPPDPWEWRAEAAVRTAARKHEQGTGHDVEVVEKVESPTAQLSLGI